MCETSVILSQQLILLMCSSVKIDMEKQLVVLEEEYEVSGTVGLL